MGHWRDYDSGNSSNSRTSGMVAPPEEIRLVDMVFRHAGDCLLSDVLRLA